MSIMLPMALLGVLGIAAAALWIYCFIDILSRTDLHGTNKAIWLLLICTVPFVGAFAYLFVGKDRDESNHQSADAIYHKWSRYR